MWAAAGAAAYGGLAAGFAAGFAAPFGCPRFGAPFIVFADSDIEAAVEWIMFGIFWNQGQVCSATSRVLVERSLYPTLLQRLSDAAQKIRIGNGLEPGVLLGPLVSAGQHAKVSAAIAQGIADG